MWFGLSLGLGSPRTLLSELQACLPRWAELLESQPGLLHPQPEATSPGLSGGCGGEGIAESTGTLDSYRTRLESLCGLSWQVTLSLSVLIGEWNDSTSSQGAAQLRSQTAE